MTRTVFIANFDDFFRTPPTDPTVIRKILRLAWRVVAYAASAEDVIVTYTQPDQEYLDHLHRVFGFSPIVNSPQKVPHTEGLCLVKAVQQDATLRRRLTNLPKGAVLQPLISTPQIVKLAQQTGLSLAGTPADLVNTGLIQRLNSKVAFTRTAEQLDIPLMPETRICSTLTMAVQQAMVIAANNPTGAVLRMDVAAGGLGNIHLQDVRAMSAFLTQHHNDDSEWNKQQLVLGAHVKVVEDVSVAATITDAGPQDPILVSRHVVNLESQGNVVPGSSLLQRSVTRDAMAYFWNAHSKGYRGPIDVDFVVYQDGDDVKHGACESNARMLLTHAALTARRNIARRRCVNEASLVVHYDESGRISLNAGLTELLDAMDATPIPDGDQVVLLPPSAGRYSYAVVTPCSDTAKKAIAGLKASLPQ